MALPARKTLEELRVLLRANIGMAAMGGAEGVEAVTLNNYLSRAQDFIYVAHDWTALRKFWVLRPGIGQQLIDFPDDMNPGRILSVSASAAVTLSYPNVQPMLRGIEWRHRNLATSGYNRPARYELRDQMEIWPAMSVTGATVIVEGVKRLDRFTQNSDKVAFVDATGVLLLAEAFAKHAHPDAASAMLAAKEYIAFMKNKDAPPKRYVQGRHVEPLAEPRPRMVT